MVMYIYIKISTILPILMYVHAGTRAEYSVHSARKESAGGNQDNRWPINFSNLFPLSMYIYIVLLCTNNLISNE